MNTTWGMKQFSIWFLIMIFLVLSGCADGGDQASGPGDGSGAVSLNLASAVSDDIKQATEKYYIEIRNNEGKYVKSVGPDDKLEGKEGTSIEVAYADTPYTVAVYGVNGNNEVLSRGEAEVKINKDNSNAVIELSDFVAEPDFETSQKYNPKSVPAKWKQATYILKTTGAEKIKQNAKYLLEYDNNIDRPPSSSKKKNPSQNYFLLDMSGLAAGQKFWFVAADTGIKNNKGNQPKPKYYTVKVETDDTEAVIEALPPLANIDKPNNNESFEKGTKIIFKGNAKDYGGNALTGNQLVWTSTNKDGSPSELSRTGESFSFSGLSVGTHTITLTATDVFGITDSKPITVTIAATQPNPTISGRVTRSDNGNGMGGVTIAFSNDDDEPFTTITHSRDGSYLQTVPYGWTGTATPSSASGGIFAPTSRPYNTAVTTNQINQDFIWRATPNQPPTAAITSPSNNSTYTHGDNVSFIGTGTDPEDGQLPASAFVWTSSIDGEIQSGRKSFSTAELSVGTHTITLTVTDSDGAMDTATIDITVEEITQPEITVQIISPPDNAVGIKNQEIQFKGRAIDQAENDLSDESAFTWEYVDNPNTILQSDPKIEFSKKITLPGTYTIKLTVTHEGLSGEAQITITIKDANETFENDLGMKFQYIPFGTFMMGLPDRNPEPNNAVLHQVTLTKGFYMQTTEVTQGQWKEVMWSNPSDFISFGDELPVQKVSWNDVQDFIKNLNEWKKTTTYRLATEAEWEYAARAGADTAFAFGDCLETDQANYDGTKRLGGDCSGEAESRGRPVAVGTLGKNAWELYDMHGNVWEWCADWYAPITDDAAVTDPTGPTGEDLPTGLPTRVRRGGAWNSSEADCRSGYRHNKNPDFADYATGFRLVKILE